VGCPANGPDRSRRWSWQNAEQSTPVAVFLRFSPAAALGFLIGLEREIEAALRRHSPGAGSRARVGAAGAAVTGPRVRPA